MEPTPYVAQSAFKHGIRKEQALHAFRNPIPIWDMEEGFHMILGVDQSAFLLEVGYVETDEAPVIVHAMPARRKFIEGRK